MLEEAARALIDAGAVINDIRECGDDDEGAKSVFNGIGVMDNVQYELCDVLGHGLPAPRGFSAVHRLPAVLTFPTIGHNPAIGDGLLIHCCLAIGLVPAIRPGPRLCH